MKYLLDSNIVIALQKNDTAAFSNLSRIPRADVVISSIVLQELFFGAYKSDLVEYNVLEIARLRYPVIDFDEKDAVIAGQIRDDLRRKGTPIGPYDVLIAGQAMSRGLTLVTRNTREFARVPGLVVEDWAA